MGLRTNKGRSRLFGGETANDRFKAGRQRTLHRSIIGSVLIHFGLFLGWADMTFPDYAAGGSSGTEYLQVLNVATLEALGPAAASVPLVVAVQDEGEIPAVPNEGLDASEAESLSEGGADRSPSLWRLATLRPEFLDPVAELQDPAGDLATDFPGADSLGSERERLRIRLGATDPQLESLTEEERLRLEQLSAFRPQLMMTSPSSWLMVRNPGQVGAFMQSRFEDSGVGVGVPGAIGVSVWVDELGSVEWAEISHSSGSSRLDDSVLEMFRTVVSLRPAREEGLRVPVAALYWLTW